MSGDHTSLNLLLFTVGGIRFGCPAEQAESMTSRNGEEAFEPCWFHEEAGFPGPVSYAAPTVVSIRTGGPRPYRVIIDSMDEIAAFRSQDIRLFPALLEPFALQRGLWAILPHKGHLVLLVDFQLLLRSKQSRPQRREIPGRRVP